MSSTGEVLVSAPRLSIKGAGRPPKRQPLRAVETRWAFAFVAPYAAVFVAFVVYPVAYAFFGSPPDRHFVELVSDPHRGLDARGIDDVDQPLPLGRSDRARSGRPGIDRAIGISQSPS